MRGLVAAFSVGSTAFGPLLFAFVRESTGSCAPALLGGAALPLAVAVGALLVRAPSSAAAPGLEP